MPNREPASPTRLVAPVRTEIVLRWIGGVVALGVGVGLAIGNHLGLLSAPAAPSAPGARPASAVAPDTVLRHPDPARPLAERWDWARAQARQLGGRGVWIGYHVRASLLVDFRGLALPGVRLAQLVGPSERSDDLALLFRFAAGRSPVLARVHAGSLWAPVHLGGEALFWLGAAEDRASLTQLRALFAEAPTVDLKEDLAVAAGLHGSSAAVVPLLNRWSASAEPPRVRAQAAKWLHHHGRAAWSAPASADDRKPGGTRPIAIAQDIPDPSGRDWFERARRQP